MVQLKQVVAPARRQPISRDRVRRLEEIEAIVWGDVIGKFTAEEFSAAGISMWRTPAYTTAAATNTDVLFFNRVSMPGIGSPIRESDIDDLIERYRSLGVRRFFVQPTPASMPTRIDQWLVDRGFRHHNNWMKLYRNVENPPEVETDLRIEIAGPRHAEIFGRMVAPAFDWPMTMAPALSRTVGERGWRHYIAYDGDEPAAVAAYYLHGDTAYIGPAVTLEKFRGRGAQLALIARRIRDAAAAGSTLCVTETAQDRPGRDVPSFRNMVRSGFQVAYARPNYLLEFAS